MSESVEVWRVERSYSDDEQNLIILKYATRNGRFVHRKERAMTNLAEADESFPDRVEVRANDLAPVTDRETQAWYREVVENLRAGGASP